MRSLMFLAVAHPRILLVRGQPITTSVTDVFSTVENWYKAPALPLAPPTSSAERAGSWKNITHLPIGFPYVDWLSCMAASVFVQLAVLGEGLHTYRDSRDWKFSEFGLNCSYFRKEQWPFIKSFIENFCWKTFSLSLKKALKFFAENFYQSLSKHGDFVFFSFSTSFLYSCLERLYECGLSILRFEPSSTKT